MKQSIQIFPLLIGAILLALSFYFFGSIWVYIVLAAIISLIVRPFTKLISKIRIKSMSIPKGLTAAISLFLFWIFLLLFFKTIIPLIANEANELSKINIEAIEEHFQEPINNIQNLSKQFFIEYESTDLKQIIQKKAKSILSLNHVKSIFSSTIATIGNIFIAFFAISFIAFFFIKDNQLLIQGILSIAPKGKEQKTEAIVKKITHLLSRYFTGLILEVSAIIILITLGLWIIGIGFSHAITIGLVAGFLNVIPYVGPLIGMAFGTVVAIATELTENVPENILPIFIGIIAVFLIAQLIDNFVLQPLIYSNSVNATPLEIFLVILMAGTLGGISGMILAIPIYTILRVIAKETLSQFKMVEKLTKNI